LVTELLDRPATPTGILLGTWTPDDPAWHAARMPGITGSEIAAVEGLSKWESPFSLWHRKRGLTSDTVENDEMKWGTLLEPVVLAEFAAAHPELHITKGGTYHHVDRPWQIGTPDGIAHPLNAGPASVVEVKTARDDWEWGEPGTDDIPVYYRAQVLWYLDALGLHHAHIPVLIGGSDYREYQITLRPDDKAAQAEIARMRASAHAFLESVRLNQRPSLDGHTATYQTVRELPDGMDDIDVEVSPELAARYDTARAAFTAAEKEKRHAAALLLDEIGTGRRATCQGKTVATRTVRDGRTYSLQPARTPRSSA
jgi:putative phage-type endonuclease